MIREIKTHIIIDRPAEKVWTVLADFKRYPRWNPFIREIHGRLKHGARIAISIGLPLRIKITLGAEILRLDPEKALSWTGLLSVPVFFENEHYFKIEPMDRSQVRFFHGEIFYGIGGYFVWRLVNAAFLNLYHDMNIALKKQVEA